MQQWHAGPPPGQNLFELSSVFSANGLAPQVAFTKTQPNRYSSHRNVRSKRTVNNDHRISAGTEQMGQQGHANHRSSHNSQIQQIHHHQIIHSQQPTLASGNPKATSILGHGGNNTINNKSSEGHHSNKIYNKDDRSLAVSSNVLHFTQHHYHHQHHNHHHHQQQQPQPQMQQQLQQQQHQQQQQQQIQHTQQSTQSQPQPSVQQTNSQTQIQQPQASQISQPQQQENDVNNTVVAPPANNKSIENDDNISHRPPGSINKEQWPPRYRRRRKDEDSNGNPRLNNNINTGQNKTSATSPNQPSLSKENSSSNATHNANRSSTQFDLEASAFPPLPGLEVSTQSNNNGNTIQQATTITTKVAIVSTEIVPEISLQNNTSAWGENRLADVVKGTAKTKSKADKDTNSSTRSSSASPPPINANIGSTNTCPNSINEVISGTHTTTSSTNPMLDIGTAQLEQHSPTANDLVLQNSTLALTPPFSPDTNTNNKLNLPVIKCTTADKSTKTDESFLNGTVTSNTTDNNSHGNICNSHTISVNSTTSPITTNAATMTSSEVSISNLKISSGIVPAITPLQANTPATTKTATQPKQHMGKPNSNNNNNNNKMPNAAGTPSIPPPSNNVQTPIQHNAQTSIPQTAISTELPASSVRLSYAQVAQHHKERLQKEKIETQQAHPEKDGSYNNNNNNNKKKDSPPNSRVSSQFGGDSRDRGGE